MTKEEAKEIFLNRGLVNGIFDGNKWRQAVVVISEWLKQEPCEDAVSRQAVNDLVDELARAISDERIHIPQRGRSIGTIMQDILDLSPITPQTKIGKWIKYAALRCGEQHYKCTNCDDYVNFGQYGDHYTKDFKFCPHCGAKMKVEENG